VKTVYLDNNATTAVAPEVLAAMEPFFRDMWGNPSSMHTFGGQVRKHIEQARQQVAELINADPSEIIFTSCGTESDNAAIRGAAEAIGPRVNIITSRVEHPAVLGPCRYLGERGHREFEVGVDAAGQIDQVQLGEFLREGPSVVSLMWANNETGVVFPIAEMAPMVKAAGGIFHTDAVQAVGKLPTDVRAVPIDMLSLSGHKLHAPKGIGALYIRKGTRVQPFMLGGHQEDNRRAGTENVPYIVGLGLACELARTHRAREVVRMAALRDRLQAGLLASCPDTRVNGDVHHRLPNTLNISFEYIEGESILYMLSDVGIAASSGSACTSGSLEPSHVLRAMGVPFTAVHGSVRFSLSRYTTEADVDDTLTQLPPIVSRLRAISPFVRKHNSPIGNVISSQ
jgi:cysteine desulfurase